MAGVELLREVLAFGGVMFACVAFTVLLLFVFKGIDR